MPKVIAKYSVVAKNEATSLLERITPCKDTCIKWSNTFVPRKAPKPFHEKVRTRTFTPEELEFFREDWLLRVAEMNLKSQFAAEERRREQLINRISDPTPPLIDRIAPRNEYVPTAPPEKELKFHKTKILARIKEFEPVLEATKTRLDPFFFALRHEDSREDLGLSFSVPAEVRTELWGWWDRFQVLYDELRTLGHDLTNAQWRQLGGAIKRIGRVSFEDLDNRIPEISQKLADLKITLP